MVLWRHGQTRWNIEDRFQGHTDVELDETGRDQAERSARLLAALRPHTIVSSDLRRARDTAEVLSQVAGVPVRDDARLRETYGGVWQGLTVDEIRAHDADAYALWRSGADVPAGGAETRSDVAARVLPAIREALEPVPSGEILVVVTHGGSARAAIGSLLDLPMDRWAVVGGLSNCCWSVLEEFGMGWRLVEHNAGSLPTPVMSDEE
ncbi:MAG TPA: histidine phosphatase family protein [Actinomycetes bacterium]